VRVLAVAVVGAVVRDNIMCMRMCVRVLSCSVSCFGVPMGSGSGGCMMLRGRCLGSLALKVRHT